MSNKERAISNGMGLLFINIAVFVIIVLKDLLEVELFNITIIACIGVLINPIMNYIKYKIMKEDYPVSFLRAVVIDSFVAILSFVYAFYLVEPGYINLFVFLGPVLYTPLIITNKKIK
ncbi:MAG: hypothetical protein LBS74_05175 [Oscillospiraceae bacterium]|jgi:hypothetical protein|nr:hypothetical protein [Oscillospiraceae bacterium]